MIARRIAGAIVAAVLMAALLAASRARIAAHAHEQAMVRVTLSARPARDEQCRTVSDEELAKLPAHMRQRVICEGVTARYRLEIRRDHRLLETVALEGGGLRRDRQIYHFSETLVPSGRGDFEVRLARVDRAAAGDSTPAGATAASSHESDDHDDKNDNEDNDDDDERNDQGEPDEADERVVRERQERERRVADEMPASLVLRETLTLAPREVLLVTYDRSARRLRLLRGTP